MFIYKLYHHHIRLLHNHHHHHHHHQKVQSKLFIRNAIKTYHFPYPSLAEISSLSPYVTISLSAAGSLMHCTSDDVTLGDYLLPKDTIVIANIYSIHMDPRYWREPHKFDPERWIDDSGKLVRSEAFMPFSVGMCSFYYVTTDDDSHVFVPRVLNH